MLKKIILICSLAILVWLVLSYLDSWHQSKKPYSQPQPARAKIEFSPLHPANFNEAKAILREFYSQGQDFYCNCSFKLEPKTYINTKSCGLKAQGIRSQRIEWEHVVPASVFGQKFSEWTEGHPQCLHKAQPEKGRNCARKASREYRQMEADLFNLMPAIGTLNAARSNFAYGEIQGEARLFGLCDFEVEHGIVEPRPEIRGDIARIYFYMNQRYPGFDIINQDNQELLNRWDQDDPMDEKERLSRIKIGKLQGNSFFTGRLSHLENRALKLK